MFDGFFAAAVDATGFDGDFDGVFVADLVNDLGRILFAFLLCIAAAIIKFELLL